ncbi:MazG nucleotide pyrophosphohydrolase domain-containing protein [Flexithrix dorotheae]|uniref:MazG nucleotide pyrophosphohydrolase domain-containing protein n=1 Tax=Flexithrix dorotheae TaxID=70993 RepID=UPI000374440F|nr:MazG nucleotide pyrophosphohydrolase domain-containing protein [Flexithrix dorotheae]
MAHLPEKPALKDFQEYIKEVCAERGWDKNNHLELFLLFTEEIGELAKAIRKHENLYHEEGKEDLPFELEEEFADVFAYLLDLANYFKVDLETAFRKKEAVNEKRKWKV